MEKIKKIFMPVLIISLFLTGLLTFIGMTNSAKVNSLDIQRFSDSNEEEGLIEGDGETIIPFTKVWQDSNVSARPSEIGVTLYKYLGEEFDLSKAIVVEKATVKASNNWEYDFNISNTGLTDGHENYYKFIYSNFH